MWMYVKGIIFHMITMKISLLLERKFFKLTNHKPSPPFLIYLCYKVLLQHIQWIIETLLSCDQMMKHSFWYITCFPAPHNQVVTRTLQLHIWIICCNLYLKANKWSIALQLIKAYYLETGYEISKWSNKIQFL